MCLKKTDEPCSCFLVVTGLEVLDANAGTILPQGADIRLKTIFMGLMRVKIATASQTDVPDAEFSAVDSLPLVFDREQNSQHPGMGELASAVFRCSIYVVASIFGSLRQHEVAA